MEPALSALFVLSALAASAGILARLVVTETAHRRRRNGGQLWPTAGPARPEWPPVSQASTRDDGRGSNEAWTPMLSGDGAWLWTGAAWVPAAWEAPSALPAQPSVALRQGRSPGCASAIGLGCLLLLGIAAAGLVALMVVIAGLAMLVAAILGA